jgi:hypothetical protein
VDFSEQPPSKQWAALKCRGEKFAEVWLKPEGEPFGLIFRIPRETFQIPGMGKQLTMENLLKAVAVGREEVESWRHADVSHAGMNGSNPDLRNALPPPPQPITHLDIYVRLKPPPEAVGRNESSEPETSSTLWQDVEALWKAILGLEAAMDTFRMNMESLVVEMQAAFKKTLTMEEKTHAPRADVVVWERAKNRVRYALPKMKDFIHRSIWAMGSPERKRLEEIYRDHIQPHIPFPQVDEVLKQLEILRKDRQVLSALGRTVYQESRSISADVQASWRTVKNNAAASAQRKKDAARSKSRFIK